MLSNIEYNDIEIFNNLLNVCFLPELSKDFGEEYLNSSDFNEFRMSLDTNLIQLFDFIQINEIFLYENRDETLQLRYKFLLLLCEQLSSDTLYQTQNKKLLNNLKCLTEKHFINILNKDQNVTKKIFDYYKSRLNVELWKKYLGTIHGFIKFCELYYEQNCQELDSNTATFLLSVGLLLRDFYEPTYKEFGYKLFYIILERTPKNLIVEMNIQNVIYDTVFQDFKKIDFGNNTKYILKCILSCLSITKKYYDFYQWNNIDDLINEFIYRIIHTSNAKICTILFVYLSKIILKCSNNSEEVEQQINNIENSNIIEFMTTNSNEIFREKCKKIITSPISYRWVKKILDLLISESNYLMGDLENCKMLLQAMYILYLICVYPIPVNILDKHLENFLSKFPTILINVLKMNKQESCIRKLVKNWFETFQKQIYDYKLNYEFHYNLFDKFLNNSRILN